MALQTDVGQVTKLSGEETVTATESVQGSLHKKGKKRSRRTRGGAGGRIFSIGDEVGKLSVGTSALPGESHSLRPECSGLGSLEGNVDKVLQSHGPKIAAKRDQKWDHTNGTTFLVKTVPFSGTPLTHYSRVNDNSS